MKKINYALAYPAFLQDFEDILGKSQKLADIETLKNTDLVIFSGGADISPEIYGEIPHATTFCSPARDKIETAVLKLSLKMGKKILGICRGHQLINATLGGKLIQHIEIPHTTLHEVTFLPTKTTDPFADEIEKLKFSSKKFGKRSFVNSYHHQAVKIPGEGLIPFVFNSSDKLIEGTIGKNILTVQYHPEFMFDVAFFRTAIEILDL